MKHLPVVLLTVSLLVSGCKDEKEKSETYANLTVEQNKAKIETEASTLLTKMNDLKSLNAVHVAEDLTVLMQVSTNESYAPVRPLVNLIAAMGKDPQQAFRLRSAVEETVSLKDYFTEMTGVYTYSKTLGTFQKEAKAGEITFIFPTGNSTTNNATITLNNVSFLTTTNKDFAGEELPKSLKLMIQNGTSTLLSIDYASQFNSDDMPANETFSISFSEGYTIKETLTNSESDVAGDVSFTCKDENVFTTHLALKGDFSYEKIDALSESEDQSMFSRMMSSANAWVQLGNLKLAGQIDVTKISNLCDEAFPKGWGEDYTTTESDVTKMAGIFNDNSQLYLMYADGTGVIAKFECYPYHDYFNSPYDQNFSYDYWTMNGRFVFKDGSAMDDSFFDTGFESLQADLEKFKTDIETSYGFIK